MKFDTTTFKLTDSGNLGKIVLVAGVLFLILSAVGYMQNSDRFFPAYLVSYVFWLTVALGGLFFTMLHHLTGARWSTALRRLSESIAGTLPLMLILFIPVIFGLHELFHWSHHEIYDPASSSFDELLSKKEPYLNPTFFYIRAAVYFTVWISLWKVLSATSLRQDRRHDDRQIQRLRKVSAPGMVAFALTITFASFDWLMSLDPHWYSTIFGVYIFSGAFLAILSFMVLVGAYLRKNNILADVITVEHYHDMGKLMFAFIIFWSYMAFSQYFLIWYANIPEENYWYLYRWENSWKTVSLIVLFGHFVIPFLGLLTRAAKRSVGFMGIMAAWILVMHWVDLYWLVIPTHHPGGFDLSWMDITTFFGIGGIFVWYFWRRYTTHPLVPAKDPTFPASIRFTNV